LTNVLVDDRLLAELLRGRRPRWLPRAAGVHTTGLFYLRLCQAYFDSDVGGKLSGPLLRLPEPRRRQVEERLLALPEEIGLISLRELAPQMGRLRVEHRRLNVLALEALAAAASLPASVLASVAAPELEAALAGEGLRYKVATP
jgi:hypothetical protein